MFGWQRWLETDICIITDIEAGQALNPFASANKGQFITKEMYAKFNCSYQGGGGWWVPADRGRCSIYHLNSVYWRFFYVEKFSEFNPLITASMMVRRYKSKQKWPCNLFWLTVKRNCTSINF